MTLNDHNRVPGIPGIPTLNQTPHIKQCTQCKSNYRHQAGHSFNLSDVRRLQFTSSTKTNSSLDYGLLALHICSSTATNTVYPSTVLTLKNTLSRNPKRSGTEKTRSFPSYFPAIILFVCYLQLLFFHQGERIYTILKLMMWTLT